MRLLLALVVALSFTSAFAQVQSSGSNSGSTTSGVRSGSTISNSNSIQRTFSNETAPAINRDNAAANRANTGGVINNTDTIGTSQSSTLRGGSNSTVPANNSLNNNSNMNSNSAAPISNGVGTNCVDVSGRSYGANDSGYTACTNSMRTR